jgi:hypothetical protein
MAPFYLGAPRVPAATALCEQWVGNKNEMPNPATKDDREQSKHDRNEPDAPALEVTRQPGGQILRRRKFLGALLVYY